MIKQIRLRFAFVYCNASCCRVQIRVHNQPGCICPGGWGTFSNLHQLVIPGQPSVALRLSFGCAHYHISQSQSSAYIYVTLFTTCRGLRCDLCDGRPCKKWKGKRGEGREEGGEGEGKRGTGGEASVLVFTLANIQTWENVYNFVVDPTVGFIEVSANVPYG